MKSVCVLDLQVRRRVTMLENTALNTGTITTIILPVTVITDKGLTVTLI